MFELDLVVFSSSADQLFRMPFRFYLDTVLGFKTIKTPNSSLSGGKCDLKHIYCIIIRL